MNQQIYQPALKISGILEVKKFNTVNLMYLLKRLISSNRKHLIDCFDLSYDDYYIEDDLYANDPNNIIFRAGKDLLSHFNSSNSIYPV